MTAQNVSSGQNADSQKRDFGSLFDIEKVEKRTPFLYLQNMKLEIWYGDYHPKSAFINAPFIKSHIVDAQK